jgi:hypothetical protein
MTETRKLAAILVADYRAYFIYADLAATYANAGKMDEAKAALAEARRLNPKLTGEFFGRARRPAQVGAAGGVKSERGGRLKSTAHIPQTVTTTTHFRAIFAGRGPPFALSAI